ncbi:amidohydrolase family protein [Haladaptatus pallidirubidus]|uniref:Amidohydrolase family protein n=1 Tax=Haladaptatus pallidirubidus TaxID=1008152 RepID=A0AAV3UHH8_9EURY|nr:amidohydrolase family protein [Haladaptatus pallidirubidus]
MPEFDLLCHGDLWDAVRGRRNDRWLAIRDGDLVGEFEEQPGDARDIRTATLFTPGLIDMHVHLVWDGTDDPVTTLTAETESELTIRAIENAQRQLRSGVTTVRDLGSPHDIAITVGRAIQSGQVSGPRTIASGRTIIISDGHDPFWGIESDGVDACRQAVRRLRGAGAEVIKVSATGGVYGQAIGEDPGAAELSLDELTAIVDEASRFDLPVAAHAVGIEGIRNAVKAGVDTLEHGNFMDEETLSQLVEDDIAYDPTLFVYREIATGSAPEYARANAERVVDHHWEVTKRAIDADARLLAGSDAGSPSTPHPSLHRELQCLVENGLNEERALAAATYNAAKELSRPEIGTLESGTSADIVGFDDDPLRGIISANSSSVVVKDGELV